MKKKNSLHILLWSICALSISVNILFFLPYWSYYIPKIENKLGMNEYFSSSDSDSQVIRAVVEASLKEKWGNEYYSAPRDPISYLKTFYRNSGGVDLKMFFPDGYLYVGLSDYALKSKSKTLITQLEAKANELINKETKDINYEIARVDQLPTGIFFLNLYKLTNKPIYKEVAHKFYLRALKFRTKGNFIPYLTGNKHYVDALGMYVPFLMSYYNATGDTLAKQICDYNMAEYRHYGVDNSTGLPTHGYDLETKIKIGSANWGRGIGWYLLAASFCPEFEDSVLDRSISHLPYTQFPLSNSSNFDSSTALMFEIYKHSRDSLRSKNIDFIKDKIRRTGMVDSISGDTFDFNNYSHRSSTSSLVNGFFLILVSRF